MATAILLKPLTFVAASPHTGAGDPNYLGNDYAGVTWLSNATAGPQLTIDLGAGGQVLDTVMLFGIEAAATAPSWQIFASTEAEGASGGSFEGYARANGGEVLYAGATKPVSGRGVALSLLPATWPTRLRYLKLGFSSDVSAIRLSRLVIGKRIQLARNFGFGAGFGVRDLGSLDFSPRGVLLRRRGAKLRTVSLTFSNIYKDEVEATTKPLLEQIGNTDMVALLTDPTPDAQRQNRCYFGPLVGDLSQVWRNAAAFETKVNLVSIF